MEENKNIATTTEAANTNMFEQVDITTLLGGNNKLPDGYVQQIYDLGYQAGKKDALAFLMKAAKTKKAKKEKKPSLKHRLAEKWLKDEQKKKGEKEN